MKNLSLFLIFLFSLSSLSFAQTNCPVGLVNDSAPGQCGLYTDNNNNNLCDLSEVASNTNQAEENCSESVLAVSNSNISFSHSDLKPKTVEEVAEIYRVPASVFQKNLENFLHVSVSPTDILQTLHDNYGLEMSKVPELIEASLSTSDSKSLPKETEDRYNFFPISIATILLYSVTFVLAKMKRIPLVLHRKIWNYVLLISFIVSGVLGLLLTFRISTGINIPLPFNMLFWHVEGGIVMGIISVFHVLWHTRYFVSRCAKLK